MKRHSAILLFSAVTSLFVGGLSILYSMGSPHAAGPLKGTLILLGVTVATYVVLAMVLPRAGKMGVASIPVRRLVWWGLFILMIVACLTSFVYIPTTALTELVKGALDPGYVSQLDESEIRLSAAFMPIWCQALLEFARRVAGPYCLVELFFGELFPETRTKISILLLATLAAFALTTLDRVIGVLYFAAPLIAMLLQRGRFGIMKNMNAYICVAGIILVIVGFKQLQYGTFRSLSFSNNSEIAKEFSVGPPQEAPLVAPPSRPSSIEPATPTAPLPPRHSSAETEKPPAAPPPRPSSVETEKPPAAPPPRPHSVETSGELTNPATPPRPSSTCAEARDGVTLGGCYVFYSLASVVERLVLSPVAMVLYSSQTYNASNFQHWSSTRLFAVLGFGRYVSPLESSEHRHHDAFPVTLIGDLWRNGGLLYYPWYALLLGIVLFLIDRLVFLQESIANQVLALFGVMFLFYGNAFNATSWMLIASSLAFATLLPRIR